MGLAPGDVVEGKYRIVRLLGEGGMGAVYEGENTRIRHRVAIKVLHAAVAAAPEVVERFEREAQAAGQIGSEHIVEVLDLGLLPNGERFMVMEFLDGQNLAQRLQAKGQLTPADLLPLMLQMLDGLGAAHSAGIVHRDLKPENVFLLRSRGGTRDFVKILDFGISKFTQGDAQGRSSATRTGSVMGTPSYMSPEQAKGSRDIDHRTDLYAVGVILYEALTGAPPFTGETFNEVLFKVVLEAPKPIADQLPGVDPRFVAIVDKAMSKAREQRFQDAAEFQQALIEWATAAGVRMLSAGSGSFTDSRFSLPHGAGRVSAALSPSGAYSTMSPSGAQGVGARTPLGVTPQRGSLPSDAVGPTQQAPGGRPATVGSWATSDGNRAAPDLKKRKSASVVFFALAGGLISVSALGAGAYFFLRSRAPSPLPDVAAASSVAPSQEEKAPELDRTEKTEPAPTVTPTTDPLPEPVASSSAQAAKAKRAPPPVAKAPAAKAPPSASAKAGNAAKPPTVSGRKIYTEL